MDKENMRKIRKETTVLQTTSFILSLMLLLVSCTGSPDSIDVGDEAPQFTLPLASGGEVALSDYLGEKPVLLYFHMAVG